jgi:hypothetical protein
LGSCGVIILGVASIVVVVTDDHQQDQHEGDEHHLGRYDKDAAHFLWPSGEALRVV